MKRIYKISYIVVEAYGRVVEEVEAESREEALQRFNSNQGKVVEEHYEVVRRDNIIVS